MTQAICFAIDFAIDRHNSQKRRSGAPYYGHLLKVMGELVNLNRPFQVCMAGVLHDTVEDTNTTIEELEASFGEEVASLVEWVSEDKSLPKPQRKQQYVEKIRQAPMEAVYISFCDKLDNLRDYTAGRGEFTAEVHQFYLSLIEVYQDRLPQEVVNTMLVHLNS
jgi:guanosine-3',5'-bis(diphosphate) 3'-pyrophosphohydrolase